MSSAHHRRFATYDRQVSSTLQEQRSSSPPESPTPSEELRGTEELGPPLFIPATVISYPPMPESFHSRLLRWKFNFIPAYRGTGGRVLFIASDLREVRVKLPLNVRTRNVVGTIFGGSMYGAVDPIFMIMLMRNLGRGYVVWDKAATIQFRRPGRSTLLRDVSAGRCGVERDSRDHRGGEPVDRLYHVDLVDAAGVVHASVEKTIYIRRREESSRRSR
jgi:acyl-coenzyme A thioesterase PaaI-like protein